LIEPQSAPRRAGEAACTGSLAMTSNPQAATACILEMKRFTMAFVRFTTEP
jgi:hypothetical protein